MVLISKNIVLSLGVHIRVKTSFQGDVCPLKSENLHNPAQYFGASSGIVKKLYYQCSQFGIKLFTYGILKASV